MSNELIVELVTGGEILAEIASKGPQGDTGDSITVVEESKDASGNTVVKFSDESEITISKGDKGDSITVSSVDKDASGNTVITFSDSSQVTVSKGDKGETGATGPQGDIWKPSVTSEGVLSWTKDSGATAPTQQNIKGDTGDVWKPSVTSAGVLSWTKNSGAVAPDEVSIKGPKGDPGEIENLTASHIENALGFLPLDKTYVDNKVKTDVPENAVFTDTNTTYTEITTAEIDTGTASTLRTITGRRVKYILDKVQGWIGGLTKSDVGLSNVTNDKQMPISGGILENYREKLVALSGTSTAINLNNGNVFTHTLSGNTTYSISNAVSGQAHSFTLIITQPSTVSTLTFPASVIWQGGEIPDMTTASKTYVLTFLTVNGGIAWLGMSGGEFLVLANRVRMSQIKKGIPSYYVMAQDSDFSGISDGKFKYIGSHEYVIIPRVIKGKNVTSYYDMFNGASTALKGVASDNPEVATMYSMFYNSQATSLDLSSFDTSNVTNMSQMFYNNQATSLDLSSFDTSNVRDMSQMFYNNQATSLDLSSFDTSNVRDMSYMFRGSQATSLDLSSFDTSNVTNMSQMFRNSLATTGYARTQADADKFNASSYKPAGLTFVVK